MTVINKGNDNKMDVDQILLNKRLEGYIKEMQIDFDLDVQTQELDLIESRFINEPFNKIEKALLNY